MGKKTCKVKGSKKVKLKRVKTSAQSKMDTSANNSSSMFVNFNEGDLSVSPSLQEAFLRFRKKKQAELAVTSSDRLRCDSKRMLRLRAKFLAQCRMYMGVPYKKRYHKPGSSEYNSKLFLDCCGLIRRAARDLSKDFGFRIGPWNQAYMFDTLPLVVESEALMQPGDLVFITAQYYHSKMRSQLHDVVHVEVWVGDGTKTIGARWHKGKVQIFDSYKFESTSYHSMRYHFRSIDTWLQGTCRSFCSQHTWKGRGNFRPTKKSVFYQGQPGVTEEEVMRNGEEMSDAEDASDEDPCSSSTPCDENRSTTIPLDVAKHHREGITLPSAESNAADVIFKDKPIKFLSFANSASLHDTMSQKIVKNSEIVLPTPKETPKIPNDCIKTENPSTKSAYYFTTEKQVQRLRKRPGSVATYVSLQTTLESNSNRVADRVAHRALERALTELRLESGGR